MQAARVQTNTIRVIEPAAAALVVAGLVALSVVMSGHAVLGWDVQITQWVRGLDFPGLETSVDLVNALTSAQMAITLWAIAMAFFVLRGRPLEALAVFSISGVWLADQGLGILVSRPGPPPEITEQVGFSLSGTFPSGHVTGAVVFYGLLSFLTLSNLRSKRLRIAVPVASISFIGLASMSRVYSLAHWPSDVLGSYLLGTIGIVAIAWVYTGIKEDRLHIPHPKRAKAPPLSDGKRVAHSIGSTVYLDPQSGTATKQYKAPWPVRALYRLAFQAPFPYQHRKEALEAAASNRTIAGLLTRYRFGRDMVAPVREVRNGGKDLQFVTEFIPGGSPRSNKEVAATLSQVYSFFQDAGLPTWQISPANPHAYSNFIRTPGGELKLIDLESSLVSFSPPWRQLLPYIRDGHYPVFDDVDFVRLRKYVSHHSSELVRSLGASGLEELNRAIDAAECSILAWKEREPRIWGRLAQWIYRRLDLSGLIGRVRTSLDKSEAMAMAFINAAIERWEREDRIEAERAAQLRNRLSTSEVRSHVKHLGAHLVLSLGLAIPIPGLRSAARFTWVLAFRLKARYDLARGRITRAEYKEARGMHSVPVMLISLLPAVGAAAYVASDTMRKHGLCHILADQFAYKLPFGLYRRLRLARITALPARGTTTRADKPLQKQPVRLQQWRPGLVEQPVQLRKQPCSERQKAPVRLAQLRPGLAGVPVTCREQKKHAA